MDTPEEELRPPYERIAIEVEYKNGEAWLRATGSYPHGNAWIGVFLGQRKWRDLQSHLIPNDSYAIDGIVSALMDLSTELHKR